MVGEKATIRLRDYLDKRKTFVIPEYQRGYVWGKKRPNEDDSVTYLLRDLMTCFKGEHQADLFLQGVTVTETDREIYLIDGQQRTTFFYLLLKFLGYKQPFRLNYLSGREQAQRYIDNVTEETCDPVEETEPFQDIYFFKKTLSIFRTQLADIAKAEFREYLLEHVNFLYVDIPQSQAERVFTMMNGNKATMRPEEVIKAEILRRAARSEACSELDPAIVEWQANMLRSRYAREWDKWLHWWNLEDVQTLFGCENPMGLLISSAVEVGDGEQLTFELFKRTFLAGKSDKEAKNVFDRLRRLQKRYEDLFNDPETHNRLGAIIAVLRKSAGATEVKSFVRDFIASPEDNRGRLDAYYRCVFLGMTHREIMLFLGICVSADKKNADQKEVFVRKYQETLRTLRDPLLYQVDPETAFRYLLRRNVDMDTAQKRRFDFGIWRSNVRSLEHIFAKSKVWHWKDESQDVRLDGNDAPIAGTIVVTEENGYLDRQSLQMPGVQDEDNGVFVTTEHGIGNLVLLYKDENSSFNNSSFEVKKELFFDPNKIELTKSRRLLHTVCVFAEQKEWNGTAIVRNAVDAVTEFKNCYKDLNGGDYV